MIFKKIRWFFLVMTVAATTQAQVQEVELPLVSHPRNPYAGEPQPENTDTINLPFFDDFSRPVHVPIPALWADQKVYVNQTKAKNTLTIGTATFDGLDEFGYAYNINRGGSDTLADVLTSRYINLTGTQPNVVLSFMYQPGGWGDKPESDDKLVVDFWAPQDSAWNRVWEQNGFESDSFHWAAIQIDDPKYLMRGFRFRIGAYGSLQGDFDNWHINRVALNGGRSLADTIFQDPSFVKPHPPITRLYSRIPWFHYTTTYLKDNIEYTYRRNGPPPTGGWPLTLGRYRIFKDNNLILNRTGAVVSGDPHNVDINFIAPLNAFSITPTDEFVLKMISYFDGVALVSVQNDSIRINQEFKNYYAYDDGSAERAYGVRNSFGAETAVFYSPLQQARFLGLNIRFVDAGENITQRGFRIVVWENRGGEPGNRIYLSDSIYFPDRGFQTDNFMPYLLPDNGIEISSGVFIGVRQIGPDPIHMGLDKNTEFEPNMWYSDGANWYQSLVDGAVMMRPFFNYAPRELGIDEKSRNALAVEAYPNPAKEKITLKNLPDGAAVSLHDLSGRQYPVSLSGDGVMNVQHLAAGMYLLSVSDEKDGRSQTIKITKE